MEDSYLSILKEVGEDPNRAGLKDTPKRAANAMRFLTQGYSMDIEEVINGALFPSSSDDGFSVINYYEVDQSLGDWSHITKISQTFQVMSDVVINHGSSKSKWFNNFKNGEGKGCDYFLSFTNHFDTKKVIRPRTSPLLQKIHTHTCLLYTSPSPRDS